MTDVATTDDAYLDLVEDEALGRAPEATAALAKDTARWRDALKVIATDMKDEIAELNQERARRRSEFTSPSRADRAAASRAVELVEERRSVLVADLQRVEARIGEVKAMYRNLRVVSDGRDRDELLLAAVELIDESLSKGREAKALVRRAMDRGNAG